MIDCKYTPYDYQMSLSSIDLSKKLRLDSSTARDGDSYFNINITGCKWSTIAVPTSLFTDWEDNPLKIHNYHNECLGENTSVSSNTFGVTIALGWEQEDQFTEDSYSIVVSVKDVLELCASLRRQQEIKAHYLKRRRNFAPTLVH